MCLICYILFQTLKLQTITILGIEFTVNGELQCRIPSL